METHEHIMAYYPLFEHMEKEHGLTLLESELQEIIRLSDVVKRKYNEASCVGGSLPSQENIDRVIKMLSEHADMDADFEDTSPDDAHAHVNGLCIKLLNGRK